MPRTHTFSRHPGGDPVDVVLDKIETFEHDDIAYCTTLTLASGQTIPVAEALDVVRRIVNDG